MLFVPWMTHEAVQLKKPLTTVAGNNLCPSPTLQCHPSFSFPFSLRAFGCSLAFLVFFPAVPDPKSDQFWCSNCYSFNLETRPKQISNAFLWLFLIVGSLLCLFDILSGQCIFKILWRHFRWNASSFSSYFSVVLQSSEQYSNTTLVLILCFYSARGKALASILLCCHSTKYRASVLLLFCYQLAKDKTQCCCVKLLCKRQNVSDHNDVVISWSTWPSK